jgi:hypothetical protein
MSLGSPTKKSPARVWARPRGRTGALGMWGRIKRANYRVRARALRGNPRNLLTRWCLSRCPNAQPPVALGSPAAPSWLILLPLYRRSVGNGRQRLSLRRLRGHTKKPRAGRPARGKRARAGGQELSAPAQVSHCSVAQRKRAAPKAALSFWPRRSSAGAFVWRGRMSQTSNVATITPG